VNGDSSPTGLLPPVLRHPLPPSLGGIKHQFLISLRKEWVNSWSASPRKARLDKLDEEFLFDKHCSLADQLTHIQGSIIFQIRSNHLPLNSYLHRIGKAPFKRCDQCWRRRRSEVSETVTHYLFECPSFDYEQHDLDKKLGRSSRDLKTILASADHTCALMTYIGRTRHFKELGDVALMKNMD
jgi:hypothetical protein